MDENLQKLELSRFISENAYGYTNTISESAQTNLSDAVLSKMFELTVGKYNKIDFSEIERSRGDVTKIRYYKNLNECINTLVDIHAVTNKIPSILIVSDALNNLLSMKNTFEYNFRIKNNVAIMIYNSVMYAIMMATSYIIAASIDIAKEETTKGANTVKVYQMDDKALCLIHALASFNASIADNSLNKFLKEAINNQEVQTESIGGVIGKGIKSAINATSGPIIQGATKIGIPQNIAAKASKGIAVAGLTLFALYLGSRIVPFIREIVYWIFRARQKISDAAALQAKFLELNIESLENTDPHAIVGRTKFLHKGITSEKLITRQTKWIHMFNSIANKFALDADKTSRDSKMDIKQDKVDVSDVII